MPRTLLLHVSQPAALSLTTFSISSLLLSSLTLCLQVA